MITQFKPKVCSYIGAGIGGGIVVAVLVVMIALVLVCWRRSRNKEGNAYGVDILSILLSPILYITKCTIS
jgi:hypothetical protein